MAISSHTNARDMPFTGLMAKRNTKYVPIALGNVVSRKDPMSRFKWIATDHFLSYQFVHAFESVTLRKSQWHKRGFPVLLGCPVALASQRFSLETGIGG